MAYMIAAVLALAAAAAGQTEDYDYWTSSIGLHRNGSFAGQVCAGATTDTNAFELLRGRHLVIDEIEWEPLAMVDPTQPLGWSGLDIDLLLRLAGILGFTYEIQDMGVLEGNESYTDLIFRRASSADLIMSYWVNTAARLGTVTPLIGHIDYSGVLTSHPRAPDSVSFPERFTTFFRPFEPSLWAALILLVMCTGFTDWILERQAGGTLADSIYEAFAGALWGGFEYPRSRASAIFQIMLGFIMLIAISAYTANLAAFLTIEHASSLQIDSIASLEDYDLPACTNLNDPNNAVYARLHAGIGFKHYGTSSEGADMLVNGTCAAIIAPAVDHLSNRRQPRNCQMKVLETILPSSAGWVTNRESWCVTAAINAAIQQLLLDGEIEDLLSKWYPSAQCVLELVEEESEGRRLQDKEGAEAAARQQARLVGRRLKGTATVAGASAGAAAASDSDGDVMGLVEFSGLFIMFLAVSLGTSVFVVLRRCYVGVAPPEQCAAPVRRLGGRVKTCLDSLLGEVPPGTIGSDDEASMLRMVLKELSEIKKHMIQHTDTEQTEAKVHRRRRTTKVKGPVVELVSFGAAPKPGSRVA